MNATSESVWAALPLPALVVNGNDEIIDVNPAGEQFFNASAKSLHGKPVWDRIFIDAPLETAFARVRTGRAPLFVNSVDVGTGDRPPETCDVQIAPMAEHTENVLVLVESRALAGKLDRAFSSKSAAKSAIGMAEMLAHEIKNPLAGISGAAQLISMSLSGEDLELTDLIVEETRRVTKLLEQVEEFGNASPAMLEPLNIHDVLDRARRLAAVGFAAHMKIRDDYDPSLPMTLADPDKLQQVFLNLLKNASEANPSGGTIVLRTFYEAGLRVRREDGVRLPVPLQIEIRDDGPGLPPELASDIFEPFVSGRENGTGLGLALVSKLIGEQDGWIAVESVPGRTVFRISLPVAPNSAQGQLKTQG